MDEGKELEEKLDALLRRVENASDETERFSRAIENVLNFPVTDDMFPHLKKKEIWSGATKNTVTTRKTL